MGFDEDTGQQSAKKRSGDESQPKTFFGLELSDGVVYTIVIILTLVFIRQVSVVIQALS
ncbi:MAG: hypothetical protein RKH07_16570 [Gammaproteobacteria bacterium]